MKVWKADKTTTETQKSSWLAKVSGSGRECGKDQEKSQIQDGQKTGSRGRREERGGREKREERTPREGKGQKTEEQKDKIKGKRYKARVVLSYGGYSICHVL